MSFNRYGDVVKFALAHIPNNNEIIPPACAPNFKLLEYLENLEVLDGQGPGGGEILEWLLL